MTDSGETFTAEFLCDWACRIEFALPETHIQFTRGQMRRQVNDAHAAVHADGPVRDEFTVKNTQAKAGAR